MVVYPQIEPIYGDREKQAVSEYLDSGGWLTEHIKTQEFERVIADFLKVKHAICVPSGTIALYLGMLSLGIGKGDEVIVPDFTMIATAQAVTMTGAMPIFVDIDEHTLCIDLAQCYHRINDCTKALVVVDLNGRSPNMSQALSVAENYGLFLIEDACQAFGSKWSGKNLGTFGDIGCFSLSHTKIITTGQGGIIVTDNNDLASKIRVMKNFGRSEGFLHYSESYGINAKFTDLQSVIGITQMTDIKGRIKQRKHIFKKYYECLGNTVQFITTTTEQVPWFVDILVDNRDDLIKHLASKGIQTRPFHAPIISQPPYESNTLVNSYNVSSRGLWLPSSLKLADSDIEYISGVINEYLRES